MARIRLQTSQQFPKERQEIFLLLFWQNKAEDFFARKKCNIYQLISFCNSQSDGELVTLLGPILPNSLKLEYTFVFLKVAYNIGIGLIVGRD